MSISAAKRYYTKIECTFDENSIVVLRLLVPEVVVGTAIGFTRCTFQLPRVE